MLDCYIDPPTISKSEYHAEQMLHHYYVDAVNSLNSFVGNVKPSFLDKLQKALKSKEEWAWRLCEEAYLNDKEIAALKWDVALMQDALYHDVFERNLD